MTTQIKITQLVDIGANLATTTLLPVVNMSGVSTTQKTNLGNLGNVILAGAGSTWKPAALANLAYSVTNAAQPNITSVGTLNINTLRISGGSNGQVLSTDGEGTVYWATGSGGGGGTPSGPSGAVQINWQGDFSNQGGTPGDTYSTLQFDSNGMPTLDGTVAYQQRVDYSPYLQILTPRVESTDFGIVAGPGLTVVGYDDNYNTPRSAYITLQDQANATQQWDTGILGYAYGNNYSISDRTNGNVWTFGTNGNLTLPDIANPSINYANGDPYVVNVPIATNSIPGIMALGNGFSLNSNNQVSTSNLYSTNLTQPTQHYVLSLDTNGVLHLPDQSIINGSTLRGVPGTGDLNYTGITIGPNSGNPENTWMWVDASNAYIATDYGNVGKTWTFDSNGNLTAPGNIIIDNGVDGNIESTGNVNVMSNGNTWQFGTDGNLTAPGNIQMSNIGGIYSSTSGYTVGLKMSNTEPSVKLVANNHEWQFNSDGVLKFPAGYSTTYPSITMGEPGNLLIQGYINGNFTEDGGNVIVSGGFGDGNNGNATVLGQQVTVKAQLSATNGSPTYSWTFDETGNLTLPQGGIITEGSIPGIGVVGNTIILTPSSGTSPTQQLLVYPTYGPDVNHLHLTSGNLANTELFLGNDDHYVKLVKTGEIEIRPNNGLTTYDSPSANWIFGKDANLSIPASYNGNGSFVNSQTTINVSSGPYYLVDIAPFGTGGGMATLSFHQDTCPGILNVAVGDTIHNVIGDYLVSTVDSVSQPNVTTITTTYNSGPQVTVNLFSFAKPGAAGGTWKFDEYGNLTIPGGAKLGDIFNDGYGFGWQASPGGYAAIASNDVLNYLAVDDEELYIQTGDNRWAFTSDGNLTVNGNIKLVTNSNLWNFDTNGTLTFPGNTLQVGLISGNSGLSSNTSAITINTTNAGGGLWTFGADGDLTLPDGNISNANVITANTFIGNGSQLTNIPTKTTGNWTLAPGVNTVSLTVPLNGTYSIWVNGNIPNGIITYTATAVVTNNNVPVLGSSYGWYYAAGNALVLTSIPTQFVGTVNNISNAVVATTTANVFTFGITNNSGANAVVNWGYTKL